MEPDQLHKIGREIEAGLPNERKAIGAAQELADFLAGDGHKYLSRRPAESEQDFSDRPKRTVELVRRVVDLLATQYAQPPTRKLADAAADAWLRAAYEAAHAAAKLAEADRQTTLAGLALMQAYGAGEGEGGGDAPIGLHLWARDEFAYWTKPRDPTRIVAVCTIDRADESTEMTLWTDELVAVYRSEKLTPGQTADGRVARLVSEEANPYGRLPFVAVGYELPTRSLDLIRGVGHVVRRHNESINEELSDLANAVRHYGRPMLVGQNIAPDQRLTLRPGTVNNLRPGGMRSAADPGPPPSLDFVQAELDIDGLWNSIRSSIGQALQDVGIPPSAYRLEDVEARSGIALLVEQAPLLKRLEARRALWSHTEAELARCCLAVAGAYYGRPKLLEAATDPGLTLWWPEPRIPIPDETLIRIEAGDLADGLTSRIQILMRRHGWTRDQAVEHLGRVAEDREIERTILGDDQAEAGPANPTPNGSESDDAMRMQEGQKGRQEGPMTKAKAGDEDGGPA